MARTSLKSALFFTGLLIFAVLLASCQRSQNQSGEPPITQDCLTAQVSLPNLSGGSVRVGQALMIQVSASGCKGMYRASRVTSSNSFVNFSNSPGLLTATYSIASSNYSEAIKVDALDSAGKVVDTGVFNSPSFVITSAPAFTCIATPNVATMSIPVNSSGVPVSPVNFTFSVSATAAASLGQVSTGGVAVSNIGLPKSISTSAPASVTIPVNTVGSQTFAFNITSTGSEFSSPAAASCNATVTTTPQSVALPVITGFSASNLQPAVGSAITLNLSTTNATSATIDGVAVTLANGSASHSVTPANTGAKNYTAVVTGPGGSVSQTLTVFVNPTCALTSSVTSAPTGSEWPVRIQISGNFTNASMAVPGLAPLSIPGNTAGLNQTFQLNVLQATGQQTAQLFVAGPDQTSGSCTVPVNLVAGAAEIILKVNGVDAAVVDVYVRTNVTFSWSFTGVNICYDYYSRPLPQTGSVTVNDVRSNTRFLVTCQLPSGQMVTDETLARVIGRWYQANLYDCNSYCGAQGLQNVPDAQGMRCASGKNRPASLAAQNAVAKPTYTYGCSVAGCPAVVGTYNTATLNAYCFYPFQPAEFVATDRTVACYCR